MDMVDDCLGVFSENDLVKINQGQYIRKSGQSCVLPAEVTKIKRITTTLESRENYDKYTINVVKKQQQMYRRI